MVGKIDYGCDCFGEFFDCYIGICVYVYLVGWIIQFKDECIGIGEVVDVEKFVYWFVGVLCYYFGQVGEFCFVELVDQGG